eukprot:13939671-Ditylum_brightwellii.AAC.3
MSDHNGDNNEKPADGVGAKFLEAVLSRMNYSLELLKKESLKEKEEEEDDISNQAHNQFEDEKAFADGSLLPEG